MTLNTIEHHLHYVAIIATDLKNHGATNSTLILNVNVTNYRYI